MYLSVHSFLIHPYVGIIQIRFAGRSSQLPLSLVHKLPICDYKAEYKNKHWKCQAFFAKIFQHREWKDEKRDNCFKSLTIHDYLEKRHMEKVLTEEGQYCIFIKSVITEITEQAAVAQ